jgi:hypothetical protein
MNNNNIFQSPEYREMQRMTVTTSYNDAVMRNKMSFMEEDPSATKEYIFDNQKEDAQAIVDMFCKEKVRLVSVQKLTKVGADGLMVEIAMRMTTHKEDDHLVNIRNVRVFTGMSNVKWREDLVKKAPGVFCDNIFHHGDLMKMNLTNDLQNGLLIIDEIDTANKENQRMTFLLKEAGLLNAQLLQEKNIHIVLISATMFREMDDLKEWGNMHRSYTMTIPENYIGHEDFLKMNIIQEFYPLDTVGEAERWVQEDIIDRYGADYRIHLVRVRDSKKINTRVNVENACKNKKVEFRIHTAEERIEDKEYKELFLDPLSNHIVIAVKGFFRRANLIPNQHKKRIGACHEMYTSTVDNNVQTQGFPGRLSGYWRDILEGGHITGPFRTSVKAMEEYIQHYKDGYDCSGDYQCAGMKKKNRNVNKKGRTMLNPPNAVNLPGDENPAVSPFKREFEEFPTLELMNQCLKKINSRAHKKDEKDYPLDSNGFKMCATTESPKVQSYDDIRRLATTRPGRELSNMPKTMIDMKNIGSVTLRCYVCYKDITDKNTECYVIIWVKRVM